MADADKVEHYFQLEFGTNKHGHTELKLKGMEISGSHTTPTITVYKKNGKIAFDLGVEIHEVDVNELSDGLKAYFGEKNDSGKSGPVPIRMPEKGDLFFTDGTPKSFEYYQRMVADRQFSLKMGENKMPSPLFPKMEKPIYEMLIRYYRTHDKNGNPYFL